MPVFDAARPPVFGRAYGFRRPIEAGANVPGEALYMAKRRPATSQEVDLIRAHLGCDRK